MTATDDMPQRPAPDSPEYLAAVSSLAALMRIGANMLASTAQIQGATDADLAALAAETAGLLRLHAAKLGLVWDDALDAALDEADASLPTDRAGLAQIARWPRRQRAARERLQ